jgi:hypothetical protein
MKKLARIGMLPAFLVFGAGVRMLSADDRFLWRSWGVRDGFPETCSYVLSMGPERIAGEVQQSFRAGLLSVAFAVLALGRSRALPWCGYR